MTITIQTRLADGIYKSSGGGQVRTHYEWATGPRNLIAAIDQFIEHRADMERCYGNVGCGGTWLEVDGVTLDYYDINDLRFADEGDAYSKPVSRTAKAKAIIERVRRGSYVLAA